MKQTDELKSLRMKSTADLRVLLDATRAELFKARFAAVTDPVDHPHKIQDSRRRIARIKTILRQRELAEIAGVGQETLRLARGELEVAKKGLDAATVELKAARLEFKRAQAKRTTDRRLDKKLVDSARKVLETAEGKAYGATKRLATARARAGDVEVQSAMTHLASLSQEPKSQEFLAAKRALGERRRAAKTVRRQSEVGK